MTSDAISRAALLLDKIYRAKLFFQNSFNFSIYITGRKLMIV